MITILAHGALGAWDEIIYLGIAVIFVGFMVISWLRSRQQADDEPLEAEPLEPQQNPDHFRLD
jgi:hypothetical protein